MKRDVARMGFAVGGEDLDPAMRGEVGQLGGDAALADSRWPDDAHDGVGTRYRLLEDPGQCR